MVDGAAQPRTGRPGRPAGAGTAATRGGDPSYSAAMALERFDGKHVLVTGGASGIGRSTALRLADEGAAVVAVDVNAGALAAVAAGAAGLSGSIVARPGDVSTEDGVRAIVSGAVDTSARSTSSSTWPGCSPSVTPTRSPSTSGTG